jgi:hypothetical protein
MQAEGRFISLVTRDAQVGRYGIHSRYLCKREGLCPLIRVEPRIISSLKREERVRVFFWRNQSWDLLNL